MILNFYFCFIYKLTRFYFFCQGYRARSSFKIIQINDKFGHFLEKSRCVIDLCAAPGSWCQVAAERCPANSLIIGVDLDRIKPIPNVITFQSDITTEHCRSELRAYMKTWKADAVLHDGAPNVGKDWSQDAFTQSELVLQSLKLAIEFLRPNGIFVTKVFRSKDYNKLMWIFQQFFEKVEATKPPSSRNVSAEIFVVCRNFKAPKKIDPKLLDSSYVFEDIQQVNNESFEKLLNPEKKKRKREGYEEGDYTQFHDVSVMEYIKTKDPVQLLGTKSAFSFDKKDPELKPVRDLESTTPELLECMKDLKVLGRREFRLLLKWRKEARKAIGLDAKPEDEEAKAEEPEVDEETRIDNELENLKEKAQQKQKREKRKLNEKKQKEIVKMQLDMVSDMRMGTEVDDQGKSLFDLTAAERTGKIPTLLKGKKALLDSEETRDDLEVAGIEKASDLAQFQYDDRSDAEVVDDMEDEMDAMYEEFKERQAQKSSAYRSKKARESGYDEEWYGIKENGSDDDDDDKDGVRLEDDSDEEDFESDEEGYSKNIINTLKPKTTASGLSSKAALFFTDPLFRDVDLTASSEAPSKKTSSKGGDEDQEDDDDEGQEQGEQEDDEESEDEIDYLSDSDDEKDQEGKEWDEGDEEEGSPAPEIVTAQAMTIAHDLALGNINKHRLIDEGFNRYAFRDRDGLPEWFLEDEEKHNRVLKPVTKEAAEAVKAKLKALNARPIKKIAEAKARKQMRRVKRLEKLRKKTDLINEDDALSERDKADEISKLTKKLATSKKNKKSDKPKVKLVVAKGGNRGLKGRPKGIKGKYKMVDGTLKKEQRALKRIQKSRKK